MSQIDFSTLMASSVHDMKNSLGFLLNSLEELGVELSGNRHGREMVGKLEYEAARLNNDLIQLLGLYRLEQDQLPVNIERHEVADFLDEVAASQYPLIRGRQMQCDVVCEPGMYGWFDENLVRGVLTNVLVNGIRYARKQLRLEALETPKGLEFRLLDDGQGYPDSMLQRFQEGNAADREAALGSRIDFLGGSTGLGLYFAQYIAGLHRKGTEQGAIFLSNGGELGGGIFTLQLP